MSEEENEELLELQKEVKESLEQYEDELEKELGEEVEKIGVKVHYYDENGEELEVESREMDPKEAIIIMGLDEEENGFSVPIKIAGTWNYVRLLVAKRNLSRTLDNEINKASGEVPNEFLAGLLE